MRMRVVPFVLLSFMLISAPAAPKPLEDPHKTIIPVSPKDDLSARLSSARPGTTLLLENGTYYISRPLVVRQRDVWIRSASGTRDDVVLDGHRKGAPRKPLRRENCVNEIIAVHASDVTIADLTVCHARDHGIHISPAGDGSANVRNVIMHNLRVADCGEQLIKVNSNGKNPPAWTDDCVLEDSLVEFTDTDIMHRLPKSFYTGGLDVHGLKGWIIRRNVFRNIQRQATMMEHAVHMWSGCRGTVVEENRFIDCFRAVGFGMKTEPRGLVRTYPDIQGHYFDHVEGLIRNNIVFNRKGIHLESGFEMMNVKDVKIYHNTVVSQNKPFSSIEYRWPETTADIRNNIVSETIMRRNDARANLKTNIEKAPADMFVDYASGDLHLLPSATKAVDRAVPIAGVLVDVDGEERDSRPDVGADEVVPGK